jgi:hypothetical protein
MKKKRKTNPRRQPKKTNKSPWHRFKTVQPKTAATPAEIIIPPVSDADSLADEIEELEADENREPDEINED